MSEAAADGFDLRIGQILIERGNLNGRGKNLAAGLRSCRYHARRASLFHETGFATHLIDKAGPLLLLTRAYDPAYPNAIRDATHVFASKTWKTWGRYPGKTWGRYPMALG
jgi:hypothetical protein